MPRVCNYKRSDSCSEENQILNSLRGIPERKVLGDLEGREKCKTVKGTIYYSFAYLDLDSVAGLIGGMPWTFKGLAEKFDFWTGVLKESGINMFLQSSQSKGSQVADAGCCPILFLYAQLPLVHQLQPFLELRALLTSQMHFICHRVDPKDNLEVGLTCIGPDIYGAPRVTRATILLQELH